MKVNKFTACVLMNHECSNTFQYQKARSRMPFLNDFLFNLPADGVNIPLNMHISTNEDNVSAKAAKAAPF